MGLFERGLGGLSGTVGHHDCIRAWKSRRGGSLFVCNKALAMHEASRTALPWILVAELISDALDKCSLVVNRQDGIGGNIDPVLCVYILASCVHSADIHSFASIRSGLPRSKVKGSLATKTTSAPRSLRDIW